MDALDAINKRRTVREYTGDSIPCDDLENIVDAGRLAPTGSNVQPWEFIVVTDKEMITKFSIDIEWVEKSGAVIAVVMDPASQWWIEDGSAAVENMLLACTALGYGACWFEGYTQKRDQMFREILSIPDSRKLFTLITVGVPANQPTVNKKSLDEVIRWEKY